MKKRARNFSEGSCPFLFFTLDRKATALPVNSSPVFVALCVRTLHCPKGNSDLKQK